jgi:hypothetical protein
MNNNIFRSVSLAAALALLAAVPAAAQTFDQYVALGDSLTAGWQSGCLVERNQVNSFPAVLARTTDVPDFQMPLVQELAIPPVVNTYCLGLIAPSLTPTAVSQMGGPLNSQLPRPYNDLAIPGLAVQDMLTLTHGDPNGTSLQKLSALVLRNVTGSPFDGTNAVQQADALLGPATGDTLVTLWIGNNNTLGASTSGIVVEGVTLISQADFQASYQAILASLLPSTRLALANVPDVTAIPFSTTIPPVLVDPTTRRPVIINGALVPLLGPGDSAYPCTPVPPDQGCGLPAGTLVNLTASSLLGHGTGVPTAAGGTGLPLPVGSIDNTGPHAGVLLYPDMVALLEQRTAEYNSVIAASATTAGATLVDVNARYKEIKAEGFEIGGITLTTSYLSGGIFSYDGIHPSSIGYMIVADAFIQALNEQGTVTYARPNFSDILFTPNVPDTGASVTTGGGPWGYTFDMWRNLLSNVSTQAASIALPAVPEGPMAPLGPSGRGTRTVSRRAEP